MKCSYCKAIVTNSKEKTCPFCGKKVQPSYKGLLITLAVVSLAAIIIAIAAHDNTPPLHESRDDTRSLQVESFKLPEIPNGYSKEIKTKYRVIEYSADRTMVNIYDTDTIKKIYDGENDIEMYPPVYYQTNPGSGWVKEVMEERMAYNVFYLDLVLIIENSDPLKVYKLREYPDNYGTILKKNYETGSREIVNFKDPRPIISHADVKKVVASNLKYKDIWKLKTFPYKNGELICGYNSALPVAIAVWWWQGGHIYNVNTVAKANTNFYATFDVAASEAYEFCKGQQ